MSSMRVRNVFYGKSMDANPDRFLSLDDFGQWIEHNLNVDQGDQLLLTSRAVQVKLESLADGQEVYVFDKKIISDEGYEKLIEDELPAEVSEYPSSGHLESIQGIINVFKAQAQWAEHVEALSQGFWDSLEEMDHQVEVIKKGTDVAVTNLRNHSTSLQKSVDSKDDFVNKLDQNVNEVSNWESTFTRLKRLVPEVSDWVKVNEVKEAYKSCLNGHKKAKRDVTQLKTKIGDIINQSTEIERSLASLTNSNIKTKDSKRQVLDEVSVLSTKIKKDLSSMQTGSQDVDRARRLNNVHQELVDSLFSCCQELRQEVIRYRSLKRQLQTDCIDILRTISRIQYQTSFVRPDIQELTASLRKVEEDRIVVAQAVDLPFLYGMYLIESLRRCQWTEQLKSTVSDTAEDLAKLKEDEAKQRRRWQKHCGDIIDQLRGVSNEDILPEVEVSLRQSDFDDGSDKAISTKEVEKYINQLQNGGFVSIASELQQELGGMLRRTSESKPRVFKNGSIANLNDSISSNSSPGRVSGTTDESTKIKAYEARIRKLEGLLHRQQYREWLESQPGQSGIPLTPPMNGTPDQRSTSVSSGPPAEASGGTSGNDGGEEERKELEQKLEAVQQQNKLLEERLQAVEQDNQSLEFTKRDLLANMSAQESEFSRERRMLHQEISELKMRVEELEEEVEKENERTAEAEVKQEHEVQRLKKHLEMVQLREHDNTKKYSDEMEQFIAKERQLSNDNEALRARVERFRTKCKDLSQRLYTGYRRSNEVLECIGLQASKEIEGNQVVKFNINRVRGLRRNSAKGIGSGSLVDNDISVDSDEKDQLQSITTATQSAVRPPGASEAANDAMVLYWMNDNDSSEEEDRYTKFTNEVYIDYDIYRDCVYDRFKAIERLARKGQQYRDRAHKAEKDSRMKISIRSFKEGDLALFLPTRDQTRDPQPWATFNVGAPHYFLKPSEGHQLSQREWLVARITKIEDRVVNRSTDKPEDNPFDLSDGLKWHWVEAIDER
uniref:Autophagy-related protein 11 n=1 Tax=Blastobotrys adeninivorans TaxID=409370 RepID=A0A060T3H7_BLAAD